MNLKIWLINSSLAAARRWREFERGDEAVGCEAVVVERHLGARALVAVVEVPRVRHHGRVGVNLKYTRVGVAIFCNKKQSKH